MSVSKVVHLDQYYRKKLIDEVEENRKSNYDIIREFPRLDDELMLSSVYKLEEASQGLTTRSYEKGVDPCYGFFGVRGMGNRDDDFLSVLVLVSTFSNYNNTQSGSRRDEVDSDEDGEHFKTLPDVATIEYLDHPSPHVGNDADLDVIASYLGEGRGGKYFASLAVTMLSPYLDGDSPFKLTSATATTMSTQDTITPDSILTLTLDGEGHHVLVNLNVDLCNREYDDFVDRITEQAESRG